MEAAAEVEGLPDMQPASGQPPAQIAAAQADRGRLRLCQVDWIAQVTLVQLQRADQPMSTQIQWPQDRAARTRTAIG